MQGDDLRKIAIDSFYLLARGYYVRDEDAVAADDLRADLYSGYSANILILTCLRKGNVLFYQKNHSNLGAFHMSSHAPRRKSQSV